MAGKKALLGWYNFRDVLLLNWIIWIEYFCGNVFRLIGIFWIRHSIIVLPNRWLIDLRLILRITFVIATCSLSIFEIFLAINQLVFKSLSPHYFLDIMALLWLSILREQCSASIEYSMNFEQVLADYFTKHFWQKFLKIKFNYSRNDQTNIWLNSSDFMLQRAAHNDKFKTWILWLSVIWYKKHSP